MPTLQPIGIQRGSLAPLLLITLFWINGCQSIATPSEGTIGSDTRWKITGQAGRVTLRSPGQSFWHRTIPGAILIPGSEVATFDGSRLELASADDKVTASGPSRFILPKSEHNGVRVRQDAGSLRYEVQSAPKRRFEVKTPHFSTVVKGTRFLVSIDRIGSEVFVDEGRVLIFDLNGVPVAELTAGQTGRMAAHPGASLEVSTASAPSFERSTAPGAGLEPSDGGNAAFPQPTRGTRASLEAPGNEVGESSADTSFFERIGDVFGAMAASISPSDPPSTQDARLGSDRGGGGLEQESRRSASQAGDDSRGGQNSKGKGKGKDKGKDKGNGKGKGKDKGNDKDKGEGRGKGVGAGRAHLILDHNDRQHLVA
jgi:hypothetical protein